MVISGNVESGINKVFDGKNKKVSIRKYLIKVKV